MEQIELFELGADSMRLDSNARWHSKRPTNGANLIDSNFRGTSPRPLPPPPETHAARYSILL